MDLVSKEGVHLTEEEKQFIKNGFDYKEDIIDIERLHYASNLNKAKQYDVTNLVDYKNTEIAEKDFVQLMTKNNKWNLIVKKLYEEDHTDSGMMHYNDLNRLIKSFY